MLAVKKLILTIAVCAGLVAAVGCGSSSDSSTETTSESLTEKPKVTVPTVPPPKKLEIKELHEGEGAEAKSGEELVVQYVGVTYENGKEFDSSWSRNEPLTFTLGAGKVIPGWEKGILGMRNGGRRELIIPPDLAYGETGFPPAIGPDETLVFVIDLLEIITPEK
jgi:peptidylprolyl isomerase